MIFRHDPTLVISVDEVLTKVVNLGRFNAADLTPEVIASKILKARITTETQANKTSSRRHMVVTFSGIRTYGSLVDVAGEEESPHRLGNDNVQGRESTEICHHNTQIRLLIAAIATTGEEQLLQLAPTIKTASPLNRVITEVVQGAIGGLSIRVLVGVDGQRPDLMKKTIFNIRGMKPE